MREIHKTVRLTLDGKPQTFRLCKLDAFSGAQLLQTVKRYLPEIESDPKRSRKIADLIDPIFLALSPMELQRLMTSCLSHTEVLLDAGYQPVMQMGEWSWPELEHDPAACLKLTLESVLWSLDSFFTGIGSSSRPAAAQEA